MFATRIREHTQRQVYMETSNQSLCEIYYTYIISKIPIFFYYSEIRVCKHEIFRCSIHITYIILLFFSSNFVSSDLSLHLINEANIFNGDNSCKLKQELPPFDFVTPGGIFFVNRYLREDVINFLSTRLTTFRKGSLFFRNFKINVVLGKKICNVTRLNAYKFHDNVSQCLIPSKSSDFRC